MCLVFATSSLIALIALGALPSGPGAEPTPAGDVTVGVGNLYYDPADVTIQVGETITWVWEGGNHDVQLRDGSEQWCPLQTSGTCDKTFDTEGFFEYHCSVHPSSMLGTVDVIAGGPAVTITSPVDGTTVTGTVDVTGTAVYADGVESVDIQVDNDAFEAASLDGTDWSYELNTLSLPNGPHKLTARATGNDGEISFARIDIDVQNLAQPDLVLLDLFGTTGNAVQPVQLTAFIENQGTAPAEDVTVRFQYAHDGAWHTIGNALVTLDPEAGVELTMPWQSTTHIGAFQVRAIADADAAYAEPNESNNQAEADAAWYTDLVGGMDLDDLTSP